jgi:hypothetical protein
MKPRARDPLLPGTRAYSWLDMFDTQLSPRNQTLIGNKVMALPATGNIIELCGYRLITGGSVLSTELCKISVVLSCTYRKTLQDIRSAICNVAGM